jgi:cytochrome c-type biogenesis protein CcmE
MTPRRKRMIAVAAIVIGVGAATAVALQAFQENIMYFYSPSQVTAGEAPAERSFRLGGLVTSGSLQRTPGSIEINFTVTDNAETIPVKYSGLLPDLFREGQGVIAHGKLGGDGVFMADEVLAKHDENYMPPEVADTLHTPKTAGGAS